jgi:hypothetical protein
MTASKLPSEKRKRVLGSAPPVLLLLLPVVVPVPLELELVLVLV